MAIYQRTNPVGLDARITEFQSYLYAKLGFANWECFDRVYMNEQVDKGLRPEAYEVNREYKDVLYDDTVDISTFFFRSSKVDRVNNGYECDVSLIVQCELPKLFPSIAHRADEELASKFELASENYNLRDYFKLEDAEYLIKNVYREFDKEQLQLDDISSRHVVRFNYRVHYKLKCA